jgi:hypothetical protein
MKFDCLCSQPQNRFPEETSNAHFESLFGIQKTKKLCQLLTARPTQEVSLPLQPIIVPNPKMDWHFKVLQFKLRWLIQQLPIGAWRFGCPRPRNIIDLIGQIHPKPSTKPSNQAINPSLGFPTNQPIKQPRTKQPSTQPFPCLRLQPTKESTNQATTNQATKQASPPFACPSNQPASQSSN